MLPIPFLRSCLSTLGPPFQPSLPSAAQVDNKHCSLQLALTPLPSLPNFLQRSPASSVSGAGAPDRYRQREMDTTQRKWTGRRGRLCPWRVLDSETVSSFEFLGSRPKPVHLGGDSRLTDFWEVIRKPGKQMSLQSRAGVPLTGKEKPRTVQEAWQGPGEHAGTGLRLVSQGQGSGGLHPGPHPCWVEQMFNPEFRGGSGRPVESSMSPGEPGEPGSCR